tara:strand:+ start:182 stop:1327 length:1146 start_codon:yes stop_codon:yes gene_type:complete
MAGGWAFVGTGSSGGTTTPGGSDTNIQFNNNGSFSGSALLTTDGSGSLSASVNISASAFYGDGSNLTGVTASAVQVADGPEFALQWRYDSPVSGELSGSQALTWNTASSDLAVTGNINVVGTISSSVRVISTQVRAPAVYVTDIPVNRVLVSTTSGQVTSHSPLTFISDVLAVPDISASVNVSASMFYGDGSNLTGLEEVSPGGSNTNIQFNNNGSFSGSALLVTDGSGSLTALTLETTSSGNGRISIGEGISYNFGGTPRLDIFENEFKLKTTQFYQAMSSVRTSNFDVRNFQVFPVNTSGSVVTGTLPGLTSDDDVGVTFTVKDSEGSGSTNNVVIAASGSQEIDSASQVKIEVNFGSVTVSAISGASDYFWSIVSTSP